MLQELSAIAFESREQGLQGQNQPPTPPPHHRLKTTPFKNGRTRIGRPLNLTIMGSFYAFVSPLTRIGALNKHNSGSPDRTTILRQHATPAYACGHVMPRIVLMLLFLVGGLSFTARGQVASGYSFAQSAGTWSAISGGTQLWNTTFFGIDFNPFNDQVSGAQTIPAFNYNGTVYTQMYVSVNGFITFGSAPSGTNYTPLSSAEAYAGAISAVGCDLHNTTNGITGTRDVRWLFNGTEIVVQWRGVRRQGVASEGFAFQIRLNPATSVIRMVYGPFNQGPGANTAIIPQVGLRGTNNTFATNVNNRSVGSGAENWATSLAGTASNSNMRLTSTAPAKSWTSGLTYTWTPCTAPAATFTVQENCAAQQFSVDVNVTSFGGGSSGVITYSVDNGVPSTLNVAALGVSSIGPFPVTSSVQASFSSNFTNCGSVSSGTLFSNCPVDLVCGNTLSVHHCYANNDTRTFTYTSDDPLGTVTVTFIGGTMAAGDVLQAYDGTDDTGTPLSSLTGSFPNLANASATSIGPSIFIKIVSDGSNSCATGQQSSWEFEVECTAPCVDPDGAVNVNTTCATFSFTIDVEILSVGDASDGTTTLRYTVNGGAPVLIPGLTEFQVQNIGPFALADEVNVRLLHPDNAGCDKNLGDFTRNVFCPPANDLCANATSLAVHPPGQCPALGTAGTTFDANTELAPPACGGAGVYRDVWYTFNSGYNTSPISINIAAGTIGNHGAEVYTACGGTLLTCASSSPAVVNLANATAFTDYRIRVFTNTALGAPGTFTICLSAAPAPSACGMSIADPGGAGGDYADNSDVTTTYCPTTPGEVMIMTFTSFDTEAGADLLRVYNGPNTTAPLVGTFSGTTIPAVVTSNHATGCLTTRFTSNPPQVIFGIPIPNSFNGYTANLSCCMTPVPTASASNNGPVCAGSTLELNCTTDIGTVFSWTGPNGFTSTLQNPAIANVTTAASGTYTVTVTNGVNGCPRVVSTTASVSGMPAAANAGPDQTMCVSGTTPLAASSPSPGTGAWTILPGSPSTAASQLSSTSSPTATFDPSGGAGVYTLRWTVSNSPCPSTQDDVEINVNPSPTTADAGPDQSICITTTPSTSLAANVPSVGTGAWSIISGPSTSLAQLSSTTANDATFTYAGGAGTYTLRWSISSASCPASTNDVAVTVLPFAQPVIQTFNANGAFTVPMGVSQITVQAWGGGGAGGGSTSAGNLQSRGGAGGGGGAYVSKTLSVTPGSTLNVSVGAAVNGTAGATGGNGNPSTITGFESQVFAAGGSGGTANTSGGSPGGGTGGSLAASQGDTETAGANGGNGATGFSFSGGASGAGGAGANGGGTGGSSVTSGSNAGNGGNPPGGGGSGSRTQNNDGTRAGGQGAAGRVIITYTAIASISATTTTICEGSSTTLTATGGGSYLWSPGGATSASIVVNPATTTNYSVQITNTCPIQLAQEVTVIVPPNAGSSNTLSLCSNDAPADMSALLGSHDAGSWSGPSTVVNDQYDPSTMVSGVYTYTVTGTAPCPNDDATVTVTENTAVAWYADADGDGFGSGAATMACAQPFAGAVTNNTDNCPAISNAGQEDGDADGVGDVCDNCPGTANIDQANADGDLLGDICDACPNDADNDIDGDGICGDIDNCPTVFGQVGNVCDANPGPGFTLGELNISCICIGVSCTQDLTIELQTDANPHQVTWELREQGTNTLIQSGTPIPPNGIQTMNTCVPDGCYFLKVLDSGGDGMVNGGYILRTAGSPGTRIIDNRRNFNIGAVSQIAGNEGFCVPFGTTSSVIYTSCDKLDWTSGQYVVCSAVPAVSALWNAGNTPAEATTGYEFQIFNPNGGYIFNRFRSHNQSDLFAPDNATRACHMKINNWAAAQHIPANVLMNVRIRTRINGVNGNWGPACRFKIDPVAAACPLTKLMDIPGDNNFSCNSTRMWGTGNYIHARPVSGATQYQWRFRIDAESFVSIRTTTTYFIQLNWVTLPLQNGKTYQVEVRAFKGGTWCVDTQTPAPGPNFTQWGDVCNLTIDNTPFDGGEETFSAQESSALRMYPNPNRGDQLYLSLDALEEGVQTVSVEIVDLYGKRVNARTITVTDSFVNTVLDLDGTMANGMYMVNITAGDHHYTERLVIQR